MINQTVKYNYPFAALLTLLIKIEGRITQKEIVESSGLSQSKISRIMNGLSLGTIKDRKQIARAISNKLKDFDGWELETFENRGKEIIRNQETKKLLNAASTPNVAGLFNNKESFPSFPKYEAGFAGELLRVFKEFNSPDIAIDAIKNLAELEKLSNVEFFRIYVAITDALRSQKESKLLSEQSPLHKTGTSE